MRIAPPPRQDRRATSKSTSEKTAQQQSNLAPAGILLTPGTRTTRRKHMSFGHDTKQGPRATRASSTEWPDGERVGLQQSNRCRRRRRHDTDDEEDYSPIAGSDAKRGKDGDVVQPPRGKRRKANTAPKRQARLRTNSPSQQAQQGPRRRQSQRRVSNPQSSGASALGEETPEAGIASFEEWPLEAVLKRVWVGGAATFQVEFTWNPCTNHERHERAPENSRRKSPAGGISSSTARTLSSRVASTTEKVQGNEYFNVEEILEWREGEDGPEYLVKWAGYGHRHNTWEPAVHFEQCLEILEQFHQEKGLPPSCM